MTSIKNLGITKRWLTICSLIYWPGMNQDIEDYIKQCPTHIKFKPTKPAEHFTSHKVPQAPGKNRWWFDGWGWYKMFSHSSYSRLFLQVHLPVSNAFYYHTCCHWPADRTIFLKRHSQEIFTNNGQPFNSREWYWFADNMASSTPHQVLTTPRPKWL